MIRLFGICIQELGDMESLCMEIGADWYAAWEARHKALAGDPARASLGGLLLLKRAGAKGSLSYSEDGRPSFLEGQLDFSITHTRETVFCAVSDRGRIGIDAEDLSRVSEEKMPALAARWFGDAEQKAFSADPTARSFLRLWTRKEAYVKRSGEGLRQMRRMDTLALPEAEALTFCEFWFEDTCITLCAERGQEVVFAGDRTVRL